MSETIFCPVQTRAARMHDDPEPAEFCENEVAVDGDFCDQHDIEARSDDEYDRYLQSKDDH